MSMHGFGKNIIVFTFLAISIVASSINTKCYATDSANLGKWFEGAWSGNIQTPSGERMVNIDIGPLTKDVKNRDKELIYAEPRACTLKAKYIGAVGENGLKYVFISSNGGFCDNLLQGNLTLEKQGNNRLSYEVTYTDRKSAQAVEKGQFWPNK